MLAARLPPIPLSMREDYSAETMVAGLVEGSGRNPTYPLLSNTFDRGSVWAQCHTSGHLSPRPVRWPDREPIRQESPPRVAATIDRDVTCAVRLHSETRPD